MDGELAAGRHQRLWDGTDDQGRSVASGIYFARLASGADHTSASIVVLR
jgi:flagellar hook assembly protein FlgD